VTFNTVIHFSAVERRITVFAFSRSFIAIFYSRRLVVAEDVCDGLAAGREYD